MASAFAHAAASTAIGAVLGLTREQWRLLALGAICSVLPDLDAIGFWAGIPYEHPLGHRGVSHSIAFAGLVGWTVVVLGFGDRPPAERRRLGAYVFLATASHGVLDAMTNGGLGVAFFAPVSFERYFFPYRPIQVSPLEPQEFFTAHALPILTTEALWVGLPSVVTILASLWWRGRCRSAAIRDRAPSRRL